MACDGVQIGFSRIHLGCLYTAVKKFRKVENIIY